ncbi:MAG TPA: Lrp/AsnC family transcriptional regulator [Thermoplasmatales archaeon]|nr:Lrp/AsnC family transcriptional regulator [Thermoplasmatales archaeon]HEX08739.1 Lrp/AsnC family transcriptional regulator [Thermoplasmatales archaeon]
MADKNQWKAFVLIKFGTSTHLNFARLTKEKIAKIERVKEVYGVFGRHDIIARVEAPSLESLASLIADKIRSIPGIISTETLVVGF